MARLGQLLVEEKLVTPDQLEEALETQVVHGGRIGTNLVEHGFLKEAELARILGKQHGTPFASGEMQPDAAALQVADRQWYDDNDVLPMRLDATRLTVAVMEPRRIQALDDLAFKVGKRLVQVVIPEFRMNQLLRKYCKAFRPMRPIDVNSLRPSKKKDGEPRPGEVAELINEADFAALYANAVAGAPEEEEVIEGVEVVEEAPPPAAAQPVPGQPTRTLSMPGVAASEPEPPPVNFAEAQALLQQSAGREDIARVVLRFARGKFRRVLLLSVQGDLVTGWRGMGSGVNPRSVARIGVSLREQNTFRMVRELRSHFVGPLKHTPGMAVFFKLLGGGFPTTAVVMPLLVRGKPVHLLYLDNGPDQLTPPDVGELMIVSQSVSRSYEALIRQRKAARAS